jgi:hypothetical protein
MSEKDAKQKEGRGWGVKNITKTGKRGREKGD